MLAVEAVTIDLPTFGVESIVIDVNESNLVNVHSDSNKNSFIHKFLYNVVPECIFNRSIFSDDVHYMNLEYPCHILFATYKTFFRSQKILSTSLPM